MATREISFQKALDEAVAEEMRRDAKIITLGTDFSGDPIKEFGPARVRFTPISEAVLTGMGLGAAGCGVRPIVTLAYYVQESLAVADELAREGISIEVIDPRTLVPMDVDTLRESVQRTGRLVIVDEAPATCSAASEIAALIVEDRDTFRALKA